MKTENVKMNSWTISKQKFFLVIGFVVIFLLIPFPGSSQKSIKIKAAENLKLKEWLQKRLLNPYEASSMMNRFVDNRLHPSPLPGSKDEWLANRKELRQQILKVLGIDDLVPPKWDLAIQHKGTIRRDGYRIEKITYESWKGMAVPALLYVPEGISDRVPGLVSIGGHAYAMGKSAEFLQQRNVNLVLRGCIVLAYDYIACGERNTGPDPLHGQPYGGGNDHGQRLFSFSERTPTGLEVLDAIRALDVLGSRPEVDPARIGFTGESGGGNTTYWISSLDPRVKLSVPVSSVTTFDYWIRNDRNWDWHQRPFGIRNIADIGTLLALHAPNPLLVISSLRRTDDQEFPLEEAEVSVQWAKNIYRLLSSENAIDLVESTTNHGYQEDKRQYLYRWVERWLNPPFPKGDVELPVKMETFDDLRCGLPENNFTLRDIYAQWLKSIPRTPDPPQDSIKQELRKFMRERLGMPDKLPPVSAKKVESIRYDKLFAEFWIIQTEPDIQLPGVLIKKKGFDNSIVLVPGRDEEAIVQALNDGHSVFTFDPRGTGEISDGGGRVRNWAWFTGHSWTGLWVYDIKQSVEFCLNAFPGSRIIIDARDRFGLSSLLCSASYPEILQSGSVIVPVATLREYLKDNKLADVPGLLEKIDIPQLRALCPQIEIKVKQ